MQTHHHQQLEYVTVRAEFERLSRDSTFSEFVHLYEAVGSRANLNLVEFSSSAPGWAALAAHWIRRLSSTRVSYLLEFDEGEDLVELVRFWSRRLDVSHERIRLRRPSQAGEFHRGPGWDRWGVMTVRCADPMLAARLQTWIDHVAVTPSAS